MDNGLALACRETGTSVQASARTPTDSGADWLYGDFGGYLYVTQEVLARTRASTQRAIVEN